MRKGPPSCHTFHAVRLGRFACNCCYGYAAKQCREHGALNGRDVRNAEEPRNDCPRTDGDRDRKRWALERAICMELAENQVGNVPPHPPEAARKPDVPHPPCGWHYINGRGPGAHCFPGGQVPSVHPRGHLGHPATCHHLGNLPWPFFQPANSGGFKLVAPFELLK